MLIHTPTKKLVLNLRNPGTVVGVIPGAKEFQFRGQPLVAVPHGVDETRVLNNIGIKVPSPIEFYYDFPNVDKPPMVHQKITAGHLVQNPRCYVLNEMGTAKTISVLWAWHYLRSIGRVDALLVIAPLSTLQRTWGDEIFGNFTDANFTVLHGDKQRRLDRVANKHDIYIINHDGVKNGEVATAIARQVLDRYGVDRVVVVVDETDAYTNSSSDRWESLNALTHRCPWLWGLTGSPTPTAPTDAWAQCKLITPWTVPKYFGRFRERVMTKVTQFKWVAKADALAEVHRVMQPGIRFTRAECFDLPERVTRFEHAEMTPEASRLYREMLTKNKAELEGEQVIALNEGVMLGKLVQIACGVLYNGADESFMIPVGPRVELVRRLVRQSIAKVILFVPLTGALDMVAETLGKDFKHVVVDGRVAATHRDERFAQFKSDPDTHLMIAHPGCMSHGLNLAEANTIIWYCPTNSNRIYVQANDRITRPGQKNEMFIIKIEGTSVEREMYARLERQGSMQGALLSAYERQRIESQG